MDRDALAAALGARITAVTAVAGGDINAAYRVDLGSGDRVFVKWQDRAIPGLFAAEAAGLDWLRAAPLCVPQVRARGDHWLALEWLELSGSPPPPRVLGRALAQLHQLGAPSFGLAAANYLATLPQDNCPERDWPTFYVERRLRPLCTRAGLGLDRELDRLRGRPELFGPPEPPARLHGDLWWGNVGAVAGAPAIFDPAVYGGHREIDLAMLALFGGLPAEVVAGYEEISPLAAGWRDRIALHQLYPLAAHACLFGGGYGAQVGRGLATCLA
jgi:fructosamine-3-kinase